MARKNAENSNNGSATNRASSSVDELLAAALENDGDSMETGRFIVTFKEEGLEEGLKSFRSQGLNVADARDFDNQALTLEDIGDADTLVFPEIGCALIGANQAQERGLGMYSEMASDSPFAIVEPEYFVFAEGVAEMYFDKLDQGMGEDIGGNVGSGTDGYLRGFLKAAETIARDLRGGGGTGSLPETEEEAMVFGATWGLKATKVPPSVRSGAGIRVAVLDTGFDLGHPDFTGRPIVSQTFVGQPVQDGNGHGTHCTGTACGTKTPAGFTQRYGIGYRSSIFIGKVLSNAGSGTTAGVLAGMNWAIANRCQVISMSLGGGGGPFAYYTSAGQAALNNGLLIVAAAGNTGPTGTTGAPANSPTVFSVASLDANLRPSSFSARGKIQIAAPGRDVFSSWPRPLRYKTISGTSMATPHVAGCAALWAETSPNLRGVTLWRKLQTTARPLPFPATQVGAGLVQAP